MEDENINKMDKGEKRPKYIKPEMKEERFKLTPQKYRGSFY